MKKAYFQYYETFENIVQKFHDIEEREFFRALIIRYGLYGETPQGLNEMMDIAFTVVKELIDDQKCRRETNAENRRGKASEDDDADSQPVETKRSTRMVRPSVEEIETYCTERKNGLNAQQFFNFYEAKGWKVGNAAMKDWKACVRTWEQRNKTTFGERSQNTLPEDRLTL